jgi:hypothetical protein
MGGRDAKRGVLPSGEQPPMCRSGFHGEHIVTGFEATFP